MAASSNLFGRIAVSQKFCTQEQLDECVREQGKLDPPPTLGQLLVKKGYLTSDSLGKILLLQQKGLELEMHARREAVTFGQLALKSALITEPQMNECLRLHAMPGEKRSLGEVMVAQGALTAIQVTDLLSKQRKKIMSCAPCKLSFTVVSSSSAASIICPRCKGALQDALPGKSVRTDAEFATDYMQSVRTATSQVMQSSTPLKPAPPVPTTPKIKTRCVICDTPLEGHLDSTGRLRCPKCMTIFAPR